MSYQLTLSIREDSPQGQNIDSVAQAEKVSREEAASRLLAAAGLNAPSKATPEALSFLGAAREDAELMDEVIELVMSDRRQHNAEGPRE